MHFINFSNSKDKVIRFKWKEEVKDKNIYNEKYIQGQELKTEDIKRKRNFQEKKIEEKIYEKLLEKKKKVGNNN